MIFSNKQKFIYIRVPKAASSTITRVLSNPYEVSGFQNKNNALVSVNADKLKKQTESIILNLNKSIDPNHIPLQVAKNELHFFFGPDHLKYEDYFKFSFVSNPFKRVVSRYFWGRDESRINDQPDVIKNSNTFREYALNMKHDTWTDFLENQFKLTEGCDFVGRCENLQNDLNVVCDKIKIKRIILPTDTTLLNTSKHEHYTEYYDDETIEIVAKRYATDIKQFGYTL